MGKSMKPEVYLILGLLVKHLPASEVIFCLQIVERFGVCSMKRTLLVEFYQVDNIKDHLIFCWMYTDHIGSQRRLRESSDGTVLGLRRDGERRKERDERREREKRGEREKRAKPSGALPGLAQPRQLGDTFAGCQVQ
ncbi:hypothetical protein Dsin_030252 [Dipteronia sinensis]|uniref:Uncharacterized protein n=1 Tax=Dipteronia sinensis TaxID=43782 RepID=A0AAD9ZIZ9_9ROSI|nr:hypothetical protein Dsin_030252 [Dipteronia sinensis]